MPHDRRWIRLVALGFLAGCAAPRARPDPAAACRPVDGVLPPGTSTSPLAGTFDFTLVATDGARAGRSVTGRLQLVPQDSGLMAVEGAMQSFRGATDVVPDSVGAVRMGSLAAADPNDPGVAVYEQHAPSGALTVVVRLGSASNARGPQPFDAGFTTLFVRRIADAGFAGGWRSSAGSTFPIRQAQGYFCAVRAKA